MLLAVLLLASCVASVTLYAASTETNLMDSSGGDLVSAKALAARLAEARANLAAAAALGDTAGVSPKASWCAAPCCSGSCGFISSDLRLMIAAAFAEYGIVIAFPQRDLHLRSAMPIPVEVVAADSRARSTPPSPAEAADKPAGIP
jgi:hypothetical protein